MAEQGRRSTVVLGAVAVALAVALIALLLRRNRDAAPPPPVAHPPVAAVDAAVADAPLPPAAETDARLRQLAESLSPRPEPRAWAAGKDLLQRFVATVDNVAEGASPRAHLDFLAPAGPFKVDERGARATISPASFKRYDTFADVIASVDAKKFAAAYREIHSWLDAAYHALGYPGRSFDVRLKDALRRIQQAPRPQGPIEVRPVGARWVYADQKLENLTAAEKHLVRLGPRNEKLVQDKAREIESALGELAAAPR